MNHYPELLKEFLNFKVDIAKGLAKQVYEKDLAFLDGFTSQKIDCLLFKPQNLKQEYLKLSEADEISQRNFLHKLFFSNTDNSIELTSLLIHLFSKTHLKESKFYIFRTLPRINNELSFWLTLRYNHIDPPNYCEKDRQNRGAFDFYFNFNDFKSPHFSDFAMEFLEAKLDLLKSTSISETSLSASYVNDLLKYLAYCYNQSTVKKEKIIELF